MNSKVTVSAAVLFVAAMFISSHGTSAAPGDVCSLTTQQEVSAALGVAVDPGKMLNPKTCQFHEQVKPGEPGWTVDVNSNSAAFYNAMKSTPTGTHTPVSGLGDEAFFALWKPGKDVNESLWVKKGDAAFNIRIWGAKPITDADREAKERAIASDVLKRL